MVEDFNHDFNLDVAVTYGWSEADGGEEDMEDEGEQQKDNDAPGKDVLGDLEGESSDDEYENQVSTKIF